MKKVGTAIVGCGMISEVYLHNMIHNFSILDVVGCCDLRTEAAEKRAQQFGIKALTMEEVIRDTSIELVINLTAPGAHYSVIRQLLEGGKNVYTEKVLSLAFEEGRELVELADRKNLYLGAAPDTFLGAGIQTARFALDSGMIGEPTGCIAVLNRDNRVGAEFIPYLAKEGGGIGFDVGIYYITALSSLLGPAEAATGFIHTRDAERKHMYPFHENFGETYRMECENQMAGTIRYRNGAIGTVLFNSECIMNPFPELTIFGTQGILYVPDPDSFAGEVKVLVRGNKEKVVVPQNHGYSENSRGLGAAEMAWAMRSGRQPRASKEMALHSLEILHGIAESGHTQKTYQMQTSFERPEPLPRGFLKHSEFADFLADQETALV